MCCSRSKALVFDILLKLQIVTAGNGIFQVGKCELSMTVTVGVSRFAYNETNTRVIDATIAAKTMSSQKNRSFRLIS